MKHYKLKRIISMVVLAAVLSAGSLNLTANAAAAAAEKITVYPVPVNFVINGDVLQPPSTQAGFIYKNSVYVPLRFAAYSFGQAVQWQQQSATVSVAQPTEKEDQAIAEYNSKNKMKLSLTSGIEGLGQKAEPKKIDGSFKAVTYIFHDEKKQPSAQLPGIIHNNTLYVPIRFFADSIGTQLNWEGTSRTVSAIVKPHVKKKPPQEEPTTGDQAEQEQAPDTSATEPTVPGTVPATPAPAPGTPAPEANPEPAKTPYDDIIADSEEKLADLEVSCSNELTVIFFRYLAAKTEADKQKAIDSGYEALDGCDSRFESLMQELTVSLQANGYDIAIVEQYRQEYAARKAEALSMIL